MRKLMIIAKTYGFISLFEIFVVCMEALYRFQKEAIGFIHFLIKSSKLSIVQKALKRDHIYKVFPIKYVHKKKIK